jgi:glycine betaine/proline transport system substrate-binding protein
MEGTAMIRRVLVALVVVLVVSGLAPRTEGGQSAGALASGKTLNLGNIGWDEDVAVNNVVQVLLQDKYGYTVNQKLADAGILYQGVASGSLDAFLDTWLPKTHATYWERYRNMVVKLPPWYKGVANLGLAVPDYVKAQSIADLNKYRSQLGGTITGIEPGAGEMRIVQTKVVPGYGLHYTVLASSTAAMLAALSAAIQRKRPIVVTLWKPHWAFTAYPIRYLKDPKGLMAGTEQLAGIVRKGLQKDEPQAYDLLSRLTLNEEQLGTLELAIKGAKDPLTGARAWVQKNPGLVNQWLKGIPKS